MIEVFHFKNRYGKNMVAVFSTDPGLMAATPIGREYAERYAAGLVKPFYPLPTHHGANEAFAISYCIELMKEMWADV